MAKTKIPGKWIAELEPDMPLIDAARRVLRIRFEAVAVLLPLAASLTDDTESHVHQLRIATRRAAAALTVFKPCLKRSARRKMRRRLSRIRRAAAEARRCDVHRRLLEHIRLEGDDSLSPVLEMVDAPIVQQRIHAMQLVAIVAGRYHKAKFRRTAKDLIRSARVRGHEGPRPALRDAAATALPALATGLLEAGHEDLRVIENIHWLRIRAKRLRYAMEVLAPCLGPTVREELYPRMQELQEHLGPINDCHEMVMRLDQRLADLEAGDSAAAAQAGSVSGGMKAGLGAGLTRLAQRFREERESHRRRFVACWEQMVSSGFFEALERAAAPPEAPVEAAAPPAPPDCPDCPDFPDFPDSPPSSSAQAAETPTTAIEIVTLPVAVPLPIGAPAGERP